MDGIREYALGIAASAMICGIILCFGGKGSLGPLLKLICGLVLTFTALGPILDIAAGDWQSLGISLETTADDAVTEGSQMAENSMRDDIAQRTETYIEDRAKDLGLHVVAAVTVSENAPLLPEAVNIRGDLSPYDRSQLSIVITKELDISEEHITWT